MMAGKAGVSRRAIEGRSEWALVLALGLAAFTVRFVAMLALRTFEFASTRDMGFEMGQLAASLASGSGFSLNGHPSAWMPPLFPAILSIVFMLVGSFTSASAMVILSLQAVVSSLTAVAVYFLGKRIFSSSVGLAAAFLWILHPGAINYSIRRVRSSSFTALGLILIIFAFIWLRNSESKLIPAIIAGLAIGLTALFNPIVLALVPIGVVWLLKVSSKPRLATILASSAMVLAAMVVLSPWTIRNQRVFHKFVPVTSTFGINLWQGNNEYVDQDGSGFRPLETTAPHISDEELEGLLMLNEVELSKFLGTEAGEFIAQKPLTFLQSTLLRIIRFWTFGFMDSGIMGEGLVLTATSTFLRMTVVLGLFGVVLARKSGKSTWLLAAALMVYPITYYITIVHTYRFRFPLESLLIIFTGYSLVWISTSLLERIGALRFKRPTTKFAG